MKRLVPSLLVQVLRENATAKHWVRTRSRDFGLCYRCFSLHCHQNDFPISGICLFLSPSEKINSAGLFFCDLILRGRFIKGHGMEGNQIRTSQLVTAVRNNLGIMGKNRVTFFKSSHKSSPTLLCMPLHDRVR